MSFDIRFRSRTATGLWIVLLAVLLGSFATAARATDCKIACKERQPCVSGNPRVAEAVTTARLVPVSGCEMLTAMGSIELRYLYKQAWFRPPEAVADKQPLNDVFRKYPPDPCALPTPQCIQQLAESQHGVLGAHAIDDQKSEPGGTNRPCALGFPCGRVLLPPEAWRFRLDDAALSGKWVVNFARGTAPSGQAAETVATVDHGVVTADGRWFVPAGQFHYMFVDPSGKMVAAGEFSTISRETLANLDTLTRRRVEAGNPESIARTDTLMRNSLVWDAMQEAP